MVGPHFFIAAEVDHAPIVSVFLPRPGVDVNEASLKQVCGFLEWRSRLWHQRDRR